MAFDKDQITTIIREILIAQKLYSETALNLLLGTMAVESDFGTFLYQKECRIAKGAFQMEPDTEKDIWKNFLRFRPEKQLAVAHISGIYVSTPAALETNLGYAICMARLHYRRIKEQLPLSDNIYGLGCYWKEFYNTAEGKGTVDEFVTSYKRYVR